jgi:hypothetical protein
MLSRSLTAVVSALALSGALASMAHADPLKPDSAVTLTDRNQWAPQAVHKSFQWDAGKGRWGVKLDLDQPVGRSAAWQDVQAGAYFNVTPSLSVGGAVALRDPTMLANQANPEGPVAVPANAPRVRLETAFKF